MTKINKSWREQRKSVLSINEDTGFREYYISVWEAAKDVAEHRAISHGTARKEIRRAIKTGAKRYGCYWQFFPEVVTYH